jgi:hypothetical protein
MYVAFKLLKFPKILIRYNMTTEQRQHISELAEQASAANVRSCKRTFRVICRQCQFGGR